MKKIGMRWVGLKKGACLWVAALFLGCGAGLAQETPLALACGAGTNLQQMLQTSFGNQAATLPFAGTTTYDFYSPPLAAPIDLGFHPRAGGTIFMTNSAPSSANDFQVAGRMQFFDHDPASGVDVLIADTKGSSPVNVVHGQTTQWTLTKTDPLSNVTIPAGHLLHLNLTITLKKGSPGGFGYLVYNGPSGSSTVALLPENAVLDWSFSSGAGAVSIPGGCVAVTFPGIPGVVYEVQAATNLASPVWVPIASASADVSGWLCWIDPDAKIFPVRFYRTVRL